MCDFDKKRRLAQCSLESCVVNVQCPHCKDSSLRYEITKMGTAIFLQKWCKCRLDVQVIRARANMVLEFAKELAK
jgi:hypothetical protein